MRFFTQYPRLFLVAALILGIVLTYHGLQLSMQVSPQLVYYNAGLREYKKGDLAKAVQFFDRSIAAYKAEKNMGWWHRFIYPRPSLEYAALANFQKGKALLQARQGERAVSALKDSIRHNSGDVYGDDESTTDYYRGFSAAQRKRLRAEALIVDYDLEMLFKNRQDLAQQEGKGKGKGKGKQGPPKKDRGNDPNNQAGKGSPDDI